MYNTSDTQTTVVIACVASLSVGYFVFLKHYLLFENWGKGEKWKEGKGERKKEVSFSLFLLPLLPSPPPPPPRLTPIFTLSKSTKCFKGMEKPTEMPAMLATIVMNYTM